jgi:hypothetical protein
MPKLPYPGGKGRLSSQIVSLLPRTGRFYVEPFCGRANLFWQAVEQGLKFERWWLNDIQTAGFLKAIKTHGDKVEIPVRSRAEFERQREAYRRGDVTATLLAPHLSFSGGLYESGCKGGSGIGDDGGGVSAAGFQRSLRQCHRILHATNPKITDLDWTRLRLEKLTEEDVVVIDGPYPGARVKAYSEATVDYDKLVSLLLKSRFRWVLCAYPDPVFHRLGNPVWAKDVPLLCVRMKAGSEERSECVWANFTPEDNRASKALPRSIRGQISTIADASCLSFSDLDSKINDGLNVVARDFSKVVPYLKEMHHRLSAPGKRSDLRKGAPSGLTWTEWVQSKRHKLGRSLRSIQYLLQGKTGISKARQALIQPRAALRLEPEWSLSDEPLEIAIEMAKLVLLIRDGGANATRTKMRLETLAEHFLRVTEERKANILANRGGSGKEPKVKTLTM